MPRKRATLSSSLKNDGRLLWVDCEMTGLEETDRLLEIACIATDRNLEALDEGISLVIKTDKAVLDQMGEWCTKQHASSGLTQRCLDAELTTGEVEAKVVEYVEEHFKDGMVLLAGSSVHADKKWIEREMPKLHALLHYRIVDVSTIRELAGRWYPELKERRNRAESDHRALSDIKSSIEDLKYFRRGIFLPGSQVSDPAALEVTGWD